MNQPPPTPGLPTCTCCGRRGFLTTGLYAAAGLLLSRAVGRATDLNTAATTGTPITNAIPWKARALPLSAVRLTGGPLKEAQDLGGKNLLKLDPDRMMYVLRKRVGLSSKATQGYGGWTGDGRNLTGHLAGHYLSAVSYMYAATGNEQFKNRADYLVNEFKAVQDVRGDGYIGALVGTNFAAHTVRSYLPGQDDLTVFHQLSEGNIHATQFDLNGLWAPWYVIHKFLAGLRDAYRQTGNRTALAISIKLAAWIDQTLLRVSDANIQKMLETEFGGINESLADLYADTGNPQWLKLSQKFRHSAIVDPLAGQHDNLAGHHANTEVAKMLGECARYIYAGNKPDGDAAKYFWGAVVNRHSFATGGHGCDEFFGPPDALTNQVAGAKDPGTDQPTHPRDFRTCESCNVYNMLKLTRLLFAIEPDAKLAEFHERALFNHVLASMEFPTGRMSFMVPVGQEVNHDYLDETSFTCCYGTGLENHALHSDGLYYASADKLWVNLYAPSTARWEEQGVSLALETNFPLGEAALLKLSLATPKAFTLALRRPAWAGEGFMVKINNDVLTDLPKPGAYVEINRTWNNGDVVQLTLPKALYKEALPDDPHRVAFLWGPLVLAADMGPGLTTPIPLGANLRTGQGPISALSRPVYGTQRLTTTILPAFGPGGSVFPSSGPQNPDQIIASGPIVPGGLRNAGQRIGVRGGAGTRGPQKAPPDPVYPTFLAEENDPVSNWLKRVEIKPTEAIPNPPVIFHATGVGAETNEVDFRPFYMLSGRCYGIYWEVQTHDAWQQMHADAAT